MVWLLPWLSLVLAIGWKALPPDSTKETEEQEGPLGWMAWLAAAVAAIAVAVLLKESLGSSARSLFGFGVGLLAGAAARPFAVPGWTGRLAQLSLAGAVVAWLTTTPNDTGALGLLGAAAGAAIVGVRGGLVWMPAFLVAAGCASALGAFGPGFRAAQSGAVVAVMASAVAALAYGAAFAFPKLQGLTNWLAVGLFGLAASVVGQRYFELPFFATTVLMGVAAAALTFWILPDEKPAPLAILGAGVLWLGVATMAFAQSRGFGMALAFAGGVAVFAMLGSRAGLMASSPLGALVVYRMLRELQPGVSRALDIGQHYGLVGLLLGVLVVLALAQWVRERHPSTAANALAFGSSLALAVGAMALLSAKGAVGLAVGLGVAPVFAALAGEGKRALPISWAGAAGIALLAVPMAPYLDLPKDEKQQWVAFAVLVALALGASAWWLARPESER